MDELVLLPGFWMFSILELLLEVFVTLVPVEGGDGVDAQIG